METVVCSDCKVCVFAFDATRLDNFVICRSAGKSEELSGNRETLVVVDPKDECDCRHYRAVSHQK